MKDEEIKQAIIAMNKIYIKRAIKAVFEKNSWDYDLKDFNLFMKLFCLLKTLICLLLGWTFGSYMDAGKFCILSYDERYCPDFQSWDAVWVSPYFFKDWNVCIGSDGT